MNQRIVSIRPNNQNAIKNALLRKKKMMDAGGAVGSLLNGVVGNNFSYGDPYPGSPTTPLNQPQQNNQFQYPGYPGLNSDMPQPTGNDQSQKKGIKFDINNMPTNTDIAGGISGLGSAFNQKTDTRQPSNNLNNQNNVINGLTKAVGSKDPVSSAIFGLGELGTGIIDSAEPNDTKGNIVGKTAGKDALTGMGVGAKIGGYFGPIGSLIGAGAGALTGGVAGIFQGDKERDELIAQQRKDQLADNQQALNQYQAKVNANPSSVYGNRYGSYFAMGGNMKKLFDDGGSIGYDDQQYNMGMSPIEQIEQMFDDQSQFQPIQDDQQQYDEDGNPIPQNQEGDDDEGTQYDEYGNPIDQSQEGDEDEGTDQDEDGDNGEDTESQDNGDEETEAQYALGGNIPQGFSKSEFYPSMAGRGKMPFQSNDLMPKGSTSFANGGRLIYEGADSLSSKVNSANRYPGPPPIGNGLIFKPIPRNSPIASQNGYPLSTEHNVINPKFAGGGNIPFVNNYPTIPRQIAPHINLAPVDNAIPGNYRGIDFRGDHQLNLPTYDDGGNVGGNEIATGLKDMLGGMGGGGGASGLMSMIGGASGGGGAAAGGVGAIAGMLANGGNLTPQWDYNPDAVNTAINPNMENYANGGGIHIKKANRGKFTASAHRAGMGVQTFAHHVLANKDKYSPKLIKRANFARNSAGWSKKEVGGVLDNRLDGMKFNANTNYVNDVMNSQYANGGNINLPDGEYDLHPAHIDQLKRNGYKIEYI